MVGEERGLDRIGHSALRRALEKARESARRRAGYPAPGNGTRMGGFGSPVEPESRGTLPYRQGSSLLWRPTYRPPPTDHLRATTIERRYYFDRLTAL